MDMQDIVNAIGEAGRNTRSDYHLTLGKAIEVIKDADKTLPVMFDCNNSYPGMPHSYRGFYSDLAFEWSTVGITAEFFLANLTTALGKTYVGYKGGDFTMTDDTPLWASDEGACGRAIMSATIEEDKVLLITKDVD